MRAALSALDFIDCNPIEVARFTVPHKRKLGQICVSDERCEDTEERLIGEWLSKAVVGKMLGRAPRPRERASAVKNEGFATLWPCRYCIITMTTVGYGDAYPVTVIGQAAGGTGLV